MIHRGIARETRDQLVDVQRRVSTIPRRRGYLLKAGEIYDISRFQEAGSFPTSRINEKILQRRW